MQLITGAREIYFLCGMQNQQYRMDNKKARLIRRAFCFYLISSDTVSRFLPLALLALITFCPLTVDILFLNPCLFLRFLFDG